MKMAGMKTIFSAKKVHQIMIGTGSLSLLAYFLRCHSETGIKSFVEETKISNSDEFKVIEEMGHDVMKIIPISESLRKQLKFYASDDLNITHVGVLKENLFSKITPTYIGLPAFFDKSYLNIDKMKFQGTSLCNYADEADALMESLTLSEDAKKFAIAQKIFVSMNNIPLNKELDCLFPILLSYFLSMFKTKNTRPITIALIYTLSTLICIYIPLTFYDGTQNKIETDCDQKAMALGPRYRRGAIEFMDKMIKRNETLRKILPDGDKLFAEDGTQWGALFSRGVLYPQRRKLLLKLIEKDTF